MDLDLLSERMPRFFDSSDSIAATIPLDIFIDDISPYLQIEDIMALRRVNKHYFHLTHEPSIWKRFIQDLMIPLPPIRPTFDHTALKTDHEFEQLVSRAISMEDNWRRKKPLVASTRFLDACLEVLDMKILPGGKYLVASIRDKYRFFIALYHLDHPNGAHILARCPLPTKAYQLHAKYMLYKGEPVIMIAYLCRILKAGGPANIDPAQFANNANIDAPDDLGHILNCVHVNLNTLELLADAYRDPIDPETTAHKLWLSNKRHKPFQQTVELELESATTRVSLYSREGVAHASVVQEPRASPHAHDYLTVINIEDTRSTYSIVPRPIAIPGIPIPHQSGMKQRIKAVRHLPEQNQVIIWRSIEVGTLVYTNLTYDHATQEYTNMIQLLDMPVNPDLNTGAFFVTPVDSRPILENNNIRAVYMSDELWSSSGEPDSYFHLQSSSQPPPPISIWAELTLPLQGVFHWHIWPTMRPLPEGAPTDTPRTYFFDFSSVTKQTMHDAEPFDGHIIPGIYRSLIYTTYMTDRTATPSLTSLRRYITPEFQGNGYPIERVKRHSIVERKDYKTVPNNVYTRIPLGEEIEGRYRDLGLGVITWDESIGRMCLTTGGGKEIQIIDFSHTASLKNRFRIDEESEGFRRIGEDERENDFVKARKAWPKVYPDVELIRFDEDVNMDSNWGSGF